MISTKEAMILDIYIKWNNDREQIKLPILPSSYEMSGKQNNTSVDINNFGEVNLRGKRGLYSISISSFFPAQYYNFCRCKPSAPDTYIKKLKKLFENNTEVHLIITKTLINIRCTIEEFTYGQSEKGMDKNYTISFKEYRRIKSVPVKKKTVTKNSKVTKPGGKRPAKPVKSCTYKWRKGDTWLKVAKKKTGSSANYKAIRKQNKKVIAKAKKKHPGRKEAVALIGYKVVIKA